MIACSQNKQQTGAKVATGFGALGTLVFGLLSIPELFRKWGEQGLKRAADAAKELISALKDALNSLLPGLGKILEPFESFFDWLKKMSGSVAQVIVGVVGGYIVLKVIRR